MPEGSALALCCSPPYFAYRTSILEASADSFRDLNSPYACGGGETSLGVLVRAKRFAPHFCGQSRQRIHVDVAAYFLSSDLVQLAL
jgi:hypothetical protein